MPFDFGNKKIQSNKNEKKSSSRFRDEKNIKSNW